MCLLTRVKEDSEEPAQDDIFKKTKIMARSSLTAWQTEGEKVDTVTEPLFLGSKIAADGACSRESGRLLLGRNATASLNSGLNSRDITLPIKVCRAKTTVCPVAMYSGESWTVKAERQRTHAFELRCRRRLLEVPWTTRSIQPILR